jgi:tetratricopeptide (TPR) repeat protein
MHPSRLRAQLWASLALMVTCVSVAAQPGAEKVIAEKLAVQTALLNGQDFLREGKPAKAVEALEDQLARIDGSRLYLLTLRDAYRAYVLELRLAKQDALAGKYLERLRILDPATAAALEAHQPAAEKKTVASATQPQPAAPAATPRYLSPLSPKLASQTRPGPTIRLLGNVQEDHELPRLGDTGAAGPQQARALLDRAKADFDKGQFASARLLFEQAHQADPATTAANRDQWAYCKISHVVEQISKAGSDAPWDELEGEVRSALAMSSAPKLTSFGQAVLEQIGQHRKAALPEAAVTHYTSASWQVAETTHFRVLHSQSRELAEKVARVAEQTRVAMSRKWLGSAGENWQPKCDVVLHATGNDYTRITGVPASSPGHSKIETDPATGRVVSRRMDLRCDNPTMVTAVLPHETTHVVLAGHFDGKPVPRWVDEGVAVLTEPAERIGQHRQNLARAQQGGDLFPVPELMSLDNYPHPRRIIAFYAQSVSLVEYLTQQKGPQVFCQFVRDGLRDGYADALRRHYGIRDLAELERQWGQAALDRAAPTVAER